MCQMFLMLFPSMWPGHLRPSTAERRAITHNTDSQHQMDSLWISGSLVLAVSIQYAGRIIKQKIKKTNVAIFIPPK